MFPPNFTDCPEDNACMGYNYDVLPNATDLLLIESAIVTWWLFDWCVI